MVIAATLNVVVEAQRVVQAEPLEPIGFPSPGFGQPGGIIRPTRFRPIRIIRRRPINQNTPTFTTSAPSTATHSPPMTTFSSETTLAPPVTSSAATAIP